MVKIADIHVIRCPKCHAEIANRSGHPQAAYYGLANEFACKSCGHLISLSPQERATRDYVTALIDNRRSFALKLGGMLLAAILIVVLVLVWLGLPPLGAIPVAFFSFLIAAFIVTKATKSQVG